MKQKIDKIFQLKITKDLENAPIIKEENILIIFYEGNQVGEAKILNYNALERSYNIEVSINEDLTQKVTNNALNLNASGIIGSIYFDYKIGLHDITK